MKFKIGDRVKVINYGSIVFFSDNKVVDIRPEIVGKSGTVQTILNGKYSIIPDEKNMKWAWYHENQLELIDENIKTEND